MTTNVSTRFDTCQMAKRQSQDGMVPVSFPPDSSTCTTGAPLEFAGEEMVLTKSQALYWPRERTLLVADLHLEKGSWYAQTGQMLPPYDSRATLERLADTIKATDARRVITLGDNFHDDAGTSRLEPHAAGMLEGLIRAHEWIWVTGKNE